MRFLLPVVKSSELPSTLGSSMSLMVMSEDVFEGILRICIMGGTGWIWLCKPLVGKLDELPTIGMVKSPSIQIPGTVEPLPTTVVEIAEPPSMLKTFKPLPAIIVGVVKPSSIKIRGMVEPLPAIVLETVEPTSVLGTVELLPAIVVETIDSPPAAVL